MTLETHRFVSITPAVAVASGVALVAVSAVAYSYMERWLFLQPALTAVVAAYVYLAIISIGSLLVIFGFSRSAAATAKAAKREGIVLVTPKSMLAYLISERRYSVYFYTSIAVYGLLFSFLTGTVVFGEVLPPYAGFVPPSALVAFCCGGPLYVPTVSVYLTNSLGFFLVPIQVILLLIVSVLVGLNLTLAIFAFQNRAKAHSSNWLAGVGAVVGLFTGCPTCAGLFFGGFLGGVGSVSFASVLSVYQPVFIALSIPVLIGTLYLTSRALSKVFRDGCVYLNESAR